MRIIHPKAFEVLNPNIRKQNLVSPGHRSWFGSAKQPAEQGANIHLDSQASSQRDHLNPSADTFVLSQFRRTPGTLGTAAGAAQTTEMGEIKTFCLSSRKQREKTLINSAASC